MYFEIFFFARQTSSESLHSNFFQKTFILDFEATSVRFHKLQSFKDFRTLCTLCIPIPIPTNKAQCETRQWQYQQQYLPDIAVITFLGTTKQLRTKQQAKCTTPFMRPQRLPLCWIWEFVSHDFPQFITGGQGLWTRLVLRSTCMYVLLQRNVPEQTLISQTLLVHGRFKSRQMANT